DDINKALLENAAKTGHVVQILTNKPRSVFYVACVTLKAGPSINEFRSVMKYAFPAESFQGGVYLDEFFDRAFDEAGNDYRRALISQLREQSDTRVLIKLEEIQKFDANEGL